MYVVDMAEETHVLDHDVKRHYLTGYLFGKVEPAFTHPESSARIGFYKVSQLDFNSMVTISTVELESKCFISTRGQYPNWPPPQVDPVPGTMVDHIKSYIEEPNDSDVEEIRKLGLELANADFGPYSFQPFHCDYWWVHSLEVPGRHPKVAF